jgi:hypothetical protein
MFKESNMGIEKEWQKKKGDYAHVISEIAVGSNFRATD